MGTLAATITPTAGDAPYGTVYEYVVSKAAVATDDWFVLSGAPAWIRTARVVWSAGGGATMTATLALATSAAQLTNAWVCATVGTTGDEMPGNGHGAPYHVGAGTLYFLPRLNAGPNQVDAKILIEAWKA